MLAANSDLAKTYSKTVNQPDELSDDEIALNWWRLNSSPHPYIPDWINDEVAGLYADSNQQYLMQLRDGL